MVQGFKVFSNQRPYTSACTARGTSQHIPGEGGQAHSSRPQSLGDFPPTTARVNYSPEQQSKQLFDHLTRVMEEHFIIPPTNSFFRSEHDIDCDIAIVVPVYNENPRDLQKTLLTLHDNITFLLSDVDPNLRIKVLVIQDGWDKAHSDMKDYLLSMFPVASVQRSHLDAQRQDLEGLSWIDALNKFTPQQNVTHSNVEFEDGSIGNHVRLMSTIPGNVLMSSNANVAVNPNNWPAADSQDSRRLDLSVLIKFDNRKKHNSHEWFLRAFASEFKAKYVFCTDCSTIFPKSVLAKLYSKITKDPTITAVTGRQRVMTFGMQTQSAFDKDGSLIENLGDRETFWLPFRAPKESFLSSWLRQVQRFDFESAFDSFMGAFSCIGILPVIPGPCGLYDFRALSENSSVATKLVRNLRAEQDGSDIVDEEGSDIVDEEAPSQENPAIEFSPIDWYFEVVTASNVGIILGNLQIAEDRVLSYASVLAVDRPMWQVAVPDAIFFFEAETNIELLLAQRRRWINGTWAGYWFLLFNSKALSLSKIGIVRRTLATFFFFLQLMMFVGVALSESIFLIALLFAERTILPDSVEGSELLDLIWYTAVAVYVFLVARHIFVKYEEWLIAISVFFNTLIVFFVLGCTASLAFHGKLVLTDVPDFSSPADHSPFTTGHLVVASFAVVLMPVFIAVAYLSPSALHLLGSLIPFVLFQPSLIAAFGSYAIARTFDLTWGNRPGVAHMVGKLRDQLQARSKTLCVFVVFINILIAFAFDAYSGIWIVTYLVTFILIVFGLLQLPFSIAFLCWFRATQVRGFLDKYVLSSSRTKQANSMLSSSSNTNQSQAGENAALLGDPGTFRSQM